MNKFTKICLIVMASCFGLGLAFLVAGTLLGGTATGFSRALERGFSSFSDSDSETEEYTQTENTSGESADSSQSSSSDIQGNENSSNTQAAENSANIQETGTFSNIWEIEVNMSAGTLCIEESDTSEFRVTTQDTSDSDIYIQEGKTGTLTVSGKSSNYQGTVTLLCPADTMLNDLEITMGTGDVVVSMPLTVTDLEVNIGAGTFTASQPITVTSSDLEAGSGQITLHRLTASEMEFTCGAGQITATVDGSQTDYSYELEVGVGQIVLGGETYSGLEIEEENHHHGSREMDISCSMGSVNIDFTE